MREYWTYKQFMELMNNEMARYIGSAVTNTTVIQLQHHIDDILTEMQLYSRTIPSVRYVDRKPYKLQVNGSALDISWDSEWLDHTFGKAWRDKDSAEKLKAEVKELKEQVSTLTEQLKKYESQLDPIRNLKEKINNFTL